MRVKKEDGIFPSRRLNGWGAILSLIILFIVIAVDRIDAQPIFEEERTEKEPPQFHFTPSLTIAELYDDNILLRGIRRESDLITRVRPGLTVEVDQARVRWLTDLSAEAEFFRDNPDLSTYDRMQSLDTHLTIRPDPRWTFDFGDTFIHSRDPTGRVTVGIPLPGGATALPGGAALPPGGTTLPLEQGGELILQRTEYYRNVLSLKGAYRLTPRLTAELEGVNRITQFKDEGLIDSSSYEIRGALPYLLTSRDTVTPQYQYRGFYFQNRGYTEVHTVSLGGTRRFTSTLTGRAMGGALVILDRNTSVPDFVVGLGADQSYSETIIFRADFTRDVALVGGLAGAFATNLLSGSMTAHVTKSFDSIVDGSWAYQHGLLGNTSSLDTLRLRLEEQFKMTTWLRLFLSYEYMRQSYHQSRSPDIYDNRLFIGIILSDTFPARPAAPSPTPSIRR